ncbi:MAG: hypothetical protein AAF203_02725 [Pseudomonadota bacterium]
MKPPVRQRAMKSSIYLTTKGGFQVSQQRISIGGQNIKIMEEYSLFFMVASGFTGANILAKNGAGGHLFVIHSQVETVGFDGTELDSAKAW